MNDEEDGVEEQELDEEELEKLPTIDAFSKVCSNRFRKKKDVVIGITGEEGEGKSTLGIQLGHRIDPRFELERNILFDPNLERLHELIYALPKRSAVLLDEFIRVGYSRNWFTMTNKFLVELYVLCRKQQKASLLCIPRFNLIDSDMRRRMLFWVHVPERGLAIILRKDSNQFIPDPWRLRENEKLMKTKTGGRGVLECDAEDYVELVSKSPNYVGFMEFDALNQEEEARYKSLQKPFELREMEHEETRKFRQALVLVSAALLREGWPMKRVAETAGISSPSLSRYFKDLGLDARAIKNEADAKKEFGGELPPSFKEIEVNI